MENTDEFYDTYETYEQLSSSILMECPEQSRMFYSQQSVIKEDHKKSEDFSEYKTDVCLPTNKLTLFS